MATINTRTVESPIAVEITGFDQIKMKSGILVKVIVGVLALAAVLIPGVADAEFSLASPFTDNAVLQRESSVPVWGKATAGSTVTVTFAGQQKSAVADPKGRWKITLDPMPASFQPRVLAAESTLDSQTLARSNFLVGEVWICSGQSNMQFAVNKSPQVQALAPKAKNIRTFNVKRTVAFTPQDTCQGEWVEQHPDSAVAFSFAYFLEEFADVPVGIILACWGSSSIEAWMPRDMTETVPHFKTIMREFDANAKFKSRIASILDGPQPWSGNDDVFLRRQSNILYNAMIHPLAPYACRGLVWYQGERNTQSMFGMTKQPWYSRNSGMLKYGATLQHWILRYRKQWGNDAMHFLVVMLPGYYKPSSKGPKLGAEHPASHSWAWMRQSQLQALALPHTSVANTIDLGDMKNVHPKDKLPVGRRLALLAAHDTLGLDKVARGPVLQRVQSQGDRMVVSFDHAEGLKTKDGKSPSAFWLADDSARWVKAEAEIKGHTVVLRSDALPKPLYVRYAFSGKPTVNLVNQAELPAYPFRTDTFKP